MKNQATPTIAHFLLHSVLSDSPPNHALKLAYKDLGYSVDEYSQDADSSTNHTGVSFGFRWLVKNIWRSHWRRYSAFSCTSEDPVPLAGILAFVWRKPLIFLADEIKSGTYRGDRPERWKQLCRWAMRRATITIVNDDSRIKLQQEYAQLSSSHTVVVYPGCFIDPPKSGDANELRKGWGVKKNEKVVCFSGACNLTTGIDLALDALNANDNIRVVTQPLSITDMDRFFLDRLNYSDRLYVQKERLTWRDAWASAGAADIGVAFYRNQAPQFQNMGVSSNRLCMFLAMGVPVIVNKQPSFDFLHEFECGIQVETQEEFDKAIKTILDNLDVYKKNALRCTKEYINTKGRYETLHAQIKSCLEA